jgi:D-alanine-D-alanine ligase
MARIGLVFGGRTVEHQVSLESARTVAAGLAASGHEVVALGIALDGSWIDRDAAREALAGPIPTLATAGEPTLASLTHLQEARPEVVFPLVHGTWGEDGSLQGLCEMLDLPYVGASVPASAVSMDKVLTKIILEAAGLPVVEFRTLMEAEFDRAPQICLEQALELGMPLFVKPARGGSSVGVTRVSRSGELFEAVETALRFDTKVSVERAVVGRELECSVLGDRELDASVIGEIVPGNEFYDYSDKYIEDGARLEAPARLSAELERTLQHMAVRSFDAVGGGGMARVDFLVEEGPVTYVNEINTLPGFTSISMFPRLWELSGISLPQLVDRLVKIALARHQRRHELDQGIKAWLSKLP